MTFTEPMPFQEAVDFLRQKGLMPTHLSSREIAMLERQIRQRAVFSARMTRLEFLSELKRLTEALVSGLRSSKEGVFMSVAEAKAQLRERLEEIGWATTEEDHGTIKDFYSDRRRQLIVETNMLDTLGAGRHIAETSAVSLDVNPAWELVRVSPRVNERDWKARWKDAGEYVGWDGALPGWKSGGRMLALKTSPIWQALGDGAGDYTDTLGNPWEPFAFNSGMGRVQIPRAEAERLGLILPGQVQQPDQSAENINKNVSAGLKKFDEELRSIFANDPLFKAEKERVRLNATNAQAIRRRATVLLSKMKEAA